MRCEPPPPLPLPLVVDVGVADQEGLSQPPAHPLAYPSTTRTCPAHSIPKQRSSPMGCTSLTQIGGVHHVSNGAPVVLTGGLASVRNCLSRPACLPTQNLYTTKLDIANNKMSVAEADRLAKEIMSGNTTNRHTAEERGLAIDDSGVRCPAGRA